MDDATLLQIDRLENALLASPHDASVLASLAHLRHSHDLAAKSLRLFRDKLTGGVYKNMWEEGRVVIDVAVERWKAMEAAPSGDGDPTHPTDARLARGNTAPMLNYSADRRAFLEDTLSAVNAVLSTQGESDVPHVFRYYQAYLSEQHGEFSVALAAVSDLIAVQSQEAGVSLAMLILRAATLLLHLGRVGESVEYLEYLNDDDIALDTPHRMLVLALLLIAYERSSDHYSLIQPITVKLTSLYRASHEAVGTDLSDMLLTIARTLVSLCDYLAALLLLLRVHASEAQDSTVLLMLTALHLQLRLDGTSLKRFADLALAASDRGDATLWDLLLVVSPSYSTQLSHLTTAPSSSSAAGGHTHDGGAGGRTYDGGAPSAHSLMDTAETASFGVPATAKTTIKAVSTENTKEATAPPKEAVAAGTDGVSCVMKGPVEEEGGGSGIDVRPKASRPEKKSTPWLSLMPALDSETMEYMAGLMRGKGASHAYDPRVAVVLGHRRAS